MQRTRPHVQRALPSHGRGHRPGNLDDANGVLTRNPSPRVSGKRTDPRSRSAQPTAIATQNCHGPRRRTIHGLRPLSKASALFVLTGALSFLMAGFDPAIHQTPRCRHG